MDLNSATDELYRLHPDEFTSARRALAAQARSEGDRGLATALDALRRPTTAAWLVNEMYQSGALVELSDLGDQLRSAHQQLDGAQLRALGSERRRLVQSLITVATRIASAAGKTAGATVLEQLRQTLEAALADPAAENAVRSGRLVLALSYSGFGEVDLTDAVLNAMPATDELATARRARAEAAAAAANDRVRAAKAVLAHASRESDRSVAEHVRASAELEDLRGKLEQAQAREEAALDAVNRNRHTHEEAQRELALAEVALAATSVGAGLERGPVQ